MNTVPKAAEASASDSSPSALTSDNFRSFHGQTILVGQLPDDFLRISAPVSEVSVGGGHCQVNGQSQLEIDQQLAASLQQQYDHQVNRRAQWASQYQAQLVITCIEARLTKNYGLVNMNPFMRLRIGNTIFETKTSHKGGKNPKWNESIRSYLPIGIDTLSIEIYDECLLTSDDLIAWASYKIPQQHLLFTTETAQHTFEESIVLSGKQGEEKEGVVVIGFSLKPVTANTTPVMVTPQAMANPMYSNAVPYVYASPHFVNQPILVHQSAAPASELLPPVSPVIRDEDVKSLQEMFPKIEIEVIKSVLTSMRGNLDRAINSLLELNSTT